MLRRLLLALLALGIGYVAASLLRSERLGAERPSAGAAGGTCVARTRSGGRCSRTAEPGSNHCWQHG